MRLLLDTCACLWLFTNDSRLPSSARKQFQDPANEIFLSPVSTWEIITKHRLGKLPLPHPPALYIPRQREKHGIEVLPLDEESVIQLDRLPGVHKDPFDRMLVCQAIAHGLVILTPDPLITQYPVRTAW